MDKILSDVVNYTQRTNMSCQITKKKSIRLEKPTTYYLKIKKLQNKTDVDKQTNRNKNNIITIKPQQQQQLHA